MRLGLAQVEPCDDPERNLETARQMAAEAKDKGVQLLVFPEMFMAAPDKSSDLPSLAESSNEPFVQGLRQIASSHLLCVVAGVWEAIPDQNKVYNALVAIDHQGRLLEGYRKVHLFDALSVAESTVMSPGDALPPVLKLAGISTGMAICYDLRFPELFRSLASRGSELILVPAAWYSGPFKEDHWLTLLKARAIENTSYVAGVSLTGPRFCARSSIVDPFGVVIASASEIPELITVDLSKSRVEQVRSKMPTLSHTRPDLFS